MSAGAPTARAGYSFEITRGGEYEVWLRVLTPGTEGLDFHLDSGNQLDLDVTPTCVAAST